MALTEEENKLIKERYNDGNDFIIKVFEIAENSEVDDLKETIEIPINKYFPSSDFDTTKYSPPVFTWHRPKSKKVIIVVVLDMEDMDAYVVDPDKHVTDVTPGDW